MTRTKLLLNKTYAFTRLCEEYPEYFSVSTGRPVFFYSHGREGFEISSSKEAVRIGYGAVSDQFRALLETLRLKSMNSRLKREYPYTFRALMIDCSRNGVIKPDYLEKIIIKLALLGYNHACLYTEDTYEVKGEPEWGYKRGRYTKSEIRRVVSFAKQFGITLFPCIQTLGHMEHILKFPKYAHLGDNERVLNVKDKKIYGLIAKSIDNAMEPYDTDLIHVGMDETWGLGRGRAFEANKRIDPRAMYIGHVKKVAEMCRSRGLKPVMWGDIVIGMSGEKSMAFSSLNRLPSNMEMNFWNYYSSDIKYYERTIKRYRKMGCEPLLSPGAWNWNRLWPSYSGVKATMPKFMEAGRRLGIKRAMMTMWGDDGQECPWDASLPALSLFAEQVCSPEPKETDAMSDVRLLGRAAFEDFVSPEEMDYIGQKGAREFTTLGKLILNDDPLQGIFSSHNGGNRLKDKYEGIYAKAEKACKRAHPENKKLFAYALACADVLKDKADLWSETRAAYLKGDRRAIKRISAGISLLIKKVSNLRKANKEVWMLERKPFGFEFLELRYGGVMIRLLSLKESLDGYLSGKQKSIPEFDEKPLSIFGRFPLVKGVLARHVTTMALQHK